MPKFLFNILSLTRCAESLNQFVASVTIIDPLYQTLAPSTAVAGCMGVARIFSAGLHFP